MSLDYYVTCSLKFSLFTTTVFFNVFYAVTIANVCYFYHHYNILYAYLNAYFIEQFMYYILNTLLYSKCCILDIFYRIVSFAL